VDAPAWAAAGNGPDFLMIGVVTVQDHKEQFLSLKVLLARLTAEETAWYLGFGAHDIPVLVANGLLKPLGHPADNAVRFFALAAVELLRGDVKWLSRHRRYDGTLAEEKRQEGRGRVRSSRSGLRRFNLQSRGFLLTKSQSCHRAVENRPLVGSSKPATSRPEFYNRFMG
jgi:hypothetical protein